MTSASYSSRVSGAGLFRGARALACIGAALMLVACAHPISIEAKKLPEREAQRSQKKVAYVMADADRQKEVTTEGGGGDKIKYFPYKDFERSLRASLASVYDDVSVVSSANDVTAIRTSGASLVFVPQITTTSSSPSMLTWPPTKFAVTVSVDVLDTKNSLVARMNVTGNGAAEWEEFKGDFGLAGRRAVEDAARALVAELKKARQLR